MQNSNFRKVYDWVRDFGKTESQMLDIHYRHHQYPSEHTENWTDIKRYAEMAGYKYQHQPEVHGYWQFILSENVEALALFSNVFLNPVHVYFPISRTKKLYKTYALRDLIADLEISRNDKPNAFDAFLRQNGVRVPHSSYTYRADSPFRPSDIPWRVDAQRW